MLDGNREQRAKDDIRRGVTGFFLDLDHTGGQTGNRRLAGRPDGGQGVAQPPPFKRRVDDAALTFPDLAIGHKDRIAKQRVQPLADAVRFGEIVGAGFQHQFNQRRIVAQITAEERSAEFGHPCAVQTRRLRRQDVAAKQPQIAQQRHLVRPGRGFGRRHCCDVKRFTGLTIRDFDGARSR